MSDSTLWYVSRGTGVVSLLLLTSVVVLGILTRAGRPLPGLLKFGVAALHRNVSLLALMFLMVHVVTIVSDSYAKVGWLDVVVPFASDFRPLWIGMGTVALELFGAVIATSLVRRRIGHRVWRLVHWSVYASWPVGLSHGLGSGRDVGQVWMVATTVACVAGVAIAVAWRVATSSVHTPQPRTVVPA